MHYGTQKIVGSIRPNVAIDLRENQNQFGGAMILLSGNFRQSLSVITRSTPTYEFNACL